MEAIPLLGDNPYVLPTVKSFLQTQRATFIHTFLVYHGFQFPSPTSVIIKFPKGPLKVWQNIFQAQFLTSVDYSWAQSPYLKQSFVISANYSKAHILFWWGMGKCHFTQLARIKLTGNCGSQFGHVYTGYLSATLLPCVHSHLLSGLKHRLFSLVNFTMLEQPHCHS